MANVLSILQPRSVAETTRLLADLGDDARVVAGATAVTIMLRQRLLAPRYLISLGGLGDLRYLQHQEGWLRIGALVSHRQVETSGLVRQHLPVLAETFGRVANVRIRNAATVGGVLAEADYASDPPAMFVALGAEIVVAGVLGERVVPAGEFFRGFYETALQSDEVVTGVRVPLPAAGSGAVYEKYISRSSEDRPCVGVAALATLADDRRTCMQLRVVVGAASDTPRRLPDAEALAHGQVLTEKVAGSVADAYAANIETLSDMRGSAWYRTEMIRVWVRRAIVRAVYRARSG